MTILEDYKTFLNSQPEEERIFETITIEHPALSQIFRFVRDTNELVAKDENDILQTYTPINFASDNTRISDDLDQLANFNLPDIENVLDDEMDRIDVGDQTKPVITYRIYLSANLDEIAEGPFVYDLESIAQSKGIFTIRSGVPRLNNRETGQTYNFTDFPMLRAL